MVRDPPCDCWLDVITVLSGSGKSFGNSGGLGIDVLTFAHGGSAAAGEVVCEVLFLSQPTNSMVPSNRSELLKVFIVY